MAAAGGRIALYYGGTLPAGLTLEAEGGSGANSGGQGTIYREAVAVDPTTSTVTVAPEQVVANGVMTATIGVTSPGRERQPQG